MIQDDDDDDDDDDSDDADGGWFCCRLLWILTPVQGPASNSSLPSFSVLPSSI